MPSDQAKRKHNVEPEKAGLESYVFGKAQPQAVPMEEAVLGALMLDREALPIVLEVLAPHSFYREAHQEIYRAIISLFNKSEPVDILTVTEQLRRDNKLDEIGGGYYLVQLTNRIASAANIEFHARIIQEKFLRRELIRLGTILVRDGYEEAQDVFEQMEGVEKAIFALALGRTTRQEQKAFPIALQVLANSEAAMQARLRGGYSGVITGITEIDRITGGLQKTDLIILAARPGMGKTAASINTIAINAAKSGTPVGVASLEMSSTQLIQRVIAAEAEIPSQRIANGNLHDSDWQRLQTAVESIENLPLYIDDTPAMSLMELRAKARRMKKKYGIGLLIIDYLQLMSGGGEKNGNREQEVAAISRGLKALAKELEIPVVALSQLSRAVETRGGTKRPQLSDLRESGQIEGDADVVVFLYRPEYYLILEDEKGRDLKGVAEFIFAKHRNGPLVTAYAQFKDTFAQFVNLPDNRLSGLKGTDEAPAPVFHSTHAVATPADFTTSRREPSADMPF